MGLSRTVSKINIDFSQKSRNFPTQCTLRPYWRGSPWTWVSLIRVKKLEWWGYQAEKEIQRYLLPSGYNPSMWQTDGRTDRHRATAKTVLTHSVLCLRIVSCSENQGGNWQTQVHLENAVKIVSTCESLFLPGHFPSLPSPEPPFFFGVVHPKC